MAGDWPAAEAALRQGADRCREMGDLINSALLDGWTAEVCRLRGDPEGAESRLQTAVAVLAPAGHRVLEAGLRIDLAILGHGRRRLDCARRHLDRARALMAEADWRGLTDRRALAEAALEPDLSLAGPMLERVVQAFRDRMLPWDEAEALLLWSRAAGPTEPALAREKRAAAVEIYRRCDAGSAWFERVAALTARG